LAGLRTLLKKDEDIKLYAVSVDSPEQSRDLTAKIAADGRGPVSFPLLSDPGHKTIDTYGLRDPAYKGQAVYGIPHPTVYVLDRTGRVTWVTVETNYRIRPTNDDIRVAIDTLK
jgi:peroxiredoxin